MTARGAALNGPCARGAGSPRGGADGCGADTTCSLASLNQAAVRQARTGDHAAAEATLTRLLDLSKSRHVTHTDLHVCYSNRAAARLALGDYTGALADADACLGLLRSAAAASGAAPAAHPAYPKAQLRRGAALLGLGRPAVAAAAFEAGLAAAPCDGRLADGLARAQQRLREAGAAAGSEEGGGGQQQRLLEAPPLPLRVCYAPSGAPLRLLRAPGDEADGRQGSGAAASDAGRLAARRVAAVEGPALPSVLLSAARAAEDPTLSDVYAYARTQSDTRAPGRWMRRALGDGYRWGRWGEALGVALGELRAAGIKNPRLLVLGAGGGMLPLLALQAGAAHVTCAERSEHLSGACRAVLASNGLSEGPSFAGGAFTVAAVRQYDELRLGQHVAAPVHLVVADLVDDGVLTGGLLPSVAHALAHLLDPSAPGPLVIPAGLDVYAQPVQMSSCPARTADDAASETTAFPASSCSSNDNDTNSPGDSAADKPAAAAPSFTAGVDFSELESLRWCPSPALPAPLQPDTLQPLAPARVAWSFDCLAVPETAGRREGEVTFETAGSVDAIVVWARVRLIRSVELTTGFDRPLALPLVAKDGAPADAPSPPPPSHQPALFWLPGRLPVDPGDTLPMLCTHNTVRLGFGFPGAQFNPLRRPTPSFPHTHFVAAADRGWLEAYRRALEAAVAVEPGSLPDLHSSGAVCGAAAAPAAVTCLDLGCGFGALGLLALQAGADSVVGVDLYEPAAACARRAMAASSAAAASGRSPALPPHAFARATVLVADAAMLARSAGGVGVTRAFPAGGFDVIVSEPFDASLVGCQWLAQMEAARAGLLAPGGRVLPAAATVWAVGVQLLAGRAGPGFSGSSNDAVQGADCRCSGSGSSSAGWDFSALDCYSWRPDAETVALEDFSGAVLLTPPVRLFEFRFDSNRPVSDEEGKAAAGEAGSSSVRYPRRAAVRLCAERGGVLTAVAVYYELDLGNGVILTTAPPTLPAPPGAARSARGQALHHLPVWLPLAPGTEFELGAERGSSGLTFSVGDVYPLVSDISAAEGGRVNCSTWGFVGGDDTGSAKVACAGGGAPVDAPRPPWLAPGRGVEDAAVWAARRCDALVGEAMMRAPAMRHPPLWCDFQLLQLHCGSLGLDSATLGEITQELAMREEAAVAAAASDSAGGATAVGPYACVEALGLGPPVRWG